MVRTTLILAALIVALSTGGTWLWLLNSEKQFALERREKFFGSAKQYPTSGGSKMKIEW